MNLVVLVYATNFLKKVSLSVSEIGQFLQSCNSTHTALSQNLVFTENYRTGHNTSRNLDMLNSASLFTC